jgi:hypothetical protein
MTLAIVKPEPDGTVKKMAKRNPLPAYDGFPAVTIGTPDGWRLHSATVSSNPGTVGVARPNEVHVSAVVNVPDRGCSELSIAVVAIDPTPTWYEVVSRYRRSLMKSCDATEAYRALRDQMLRNDGFLGGDFGYRAIRERAEEVLKKLASEVRP